MVHAADLGLAVPQAGGDARTQRGHDQEIFIEDEVLTGQDLHGLGLEVRVIKEERGFAGLGHAGFELDQTVRALAQDRRVADA